MRPSSTTCRSAWFSFILYRPRFCSLPQILPQLYPNHNSPNQILILCSLQLLMFPLPRIMPGGSRSPFFNCSFDFQKQDAKNFFSFSFFSSNWTCEDFLCIQINIHLPIGAKCKDLLFHLAFWSGVQRNSVLCIRFIVHLTFGARCKNFGTVSASVLTQLIFVYKTTSIQLISLSLSSPA